MSAGRPMSDVRGACAECGHLHYIGPRDGYDTCPIDGCDCHGQAWAQSPSFRATRETPADVLAGVSDALRSLALQSDRYDAALLEVWEKIAGLDGAVAELRGDIDRLDRLGSVKA